MKVLCFGVAKDIVGGSEIILSKEAVITVADLKIYLNKSYPEFLKYKNYMVAVNQAYANDHATISSNDEIAIIPPVSGG